MSPTRIHVWEEDPGAHSARRSPIAQPTRDISKSPLSFDVIDRAPGPYSPAAEKLRYETAIDSLIRAVDWFAEAMNGRSLSWHEDVGRTLRVTLEGGDELNAFYHREGPKKGLRFCTPTTAGKKIHTCESPDIVCHEVGHALLDGLRPQFLHAAGLEYFAFHEAFGDASSILSSLTLDSFCSNVLHETGGKINFTSRLSRMAEQFSEAVRLLNPGKSDQNCLRDAANEFFYADPLNLPFRAPATAICGRMHSFSRIFSATILDVLDAFYQPPHFSIPDLKAAAANTGKILCRATEMTPISPWYWADMAAHMIAVDLKEFGGQQTESLRRIFLKRGILSFEDLESLTMERLDSVDLKDSAPDSDRESPTATLLVDGARYGIDRGYEVEIPNQAPRLVRIEVPAEERHKYAEKIARYSIESAFIEGRVGITKNLCIDGAPLMPKNESRTFTHEVQETDAGSAVLRRVAFIHG